ncbi:hypothetical protein [Parasitella parasitica]|uniref:Homeobox domain-containing protein n=1 Tax=Parasitella parasitica TaxID=35722 RepID=A0A0B7N962_9FUNG|nr:hypothetical protein [Parasitella parasitica]
MSFVENLSIRKPSETNPTQLGNYSISNGRNNSFVAKFYRPYEIKRRKRTSRAQFKVLEKIFIENPKPNSRTRRALADDLHMTPRSVQVWFQNRRAKQKQINVKDEKHKNQSEQHQSDSQDTIFDLPTINMLHSRSQSSSTSSTNKMWVSDNSTVNDEEEELTALRTPPNNHSSQLLVEHENEWQTTYDGTMVPCINHQTFAAEMKSDSIAISDAATVAAFSSATADNVAAFGVVAAFGATADGVATASECDVHMNAWSENYGAQPCLPMTGTHNMTSHDYTMRSLPIDEVAYWVQSSQLSNDLLLDGLLHVNCSEFISKRSIDLINQEEAYQIGQQVL